MRPRTSSTATTAATSAPRVDDREGRQEWLREAKRRLQAERAATPAGTPLSSGKLEGGQAAVGGGALGRAARQRCL